jgi:hypothetical protein
MNRHILAVTPSRRKPDAPSFYVSKRTIFHSVSLQSMRQKKNASLMPGARTAEETAFLIAYLSSNKFDIIALFPGQKHASDV